MICEYIKILLIHKILDFSDSWLLIRLTDKEFWPIRPQLKTFFSFISIKIIINKNTHLGDFIYLFVYDYGTPTTYSLEHSTQAI